MTPRRRKHDPYTLKQVRALRAAGAALGVSPSRLDEMVEGIRHQARWALSHREPLDGDSARSPRGLEKSLGQVRLHLERALVALGRGGAQAAARLEDGLVAGAVDGREVPVELLQVPAERALRALAESARRATSLEAKPAPQVDSGPRQEWLYEMVDAVTGLVEECCAQAGGGRWGSDRDAPTALGRLLSVAVEPLGLDVDLDAVMAGVLAFRDKRLEKGIDYLRGELAGGPRPVAELLRRAVELGIPDDGLERARRRLGIREELHRGVPSWSSEVGSSSAQADYVTNIRARSTSK